MSAEQGSEVVVVTGASGGVGQSHRPRVRPSRCPRRPACERRVRAWRRRHEVEHLGGAGLVAAHRCRSTPTGRGSRDAVEQRFGPIDIWVNDAMATIFAPVPRDDRSGVPARDRSDLPGCGLRHDGRAVEDGAARPWDGRTSRLRPRVSGDPASVRLLRREVRDAWVHRLGTHRTDARQSRVWITMVQLPAVNTPQFNWCRTRLPDHPATGATDLPAGSPR